MTDNRQRETFSQLYAFLGQRTSDADGDVWVHGALQVLVRDLMCGPMTTALDAAEARGRAVADRQWRERIKKLADDYDDGSEWAMCAHSGVTVAFALRALAAS